MAKTDNRKLSLWQERLEKNQASNAAEYEKMTQREALYKGEADRIRPLVPEDKNRDGSFKRARHIRNIISENIESQVSTSVPQPKVTARRAEDEQKARAYIRTIPSPGGIGAADALCSAVSLRDGFEFAGAQK